LRLSVQRDYIHDVSTFCPPLSGGLFLRRGPGAARDLVKVSERAPVFAGLRGRACL
jgi:hypothetical protein